jgi:phospholipid N-methyltransferase
MDRKASAYGRGDAFGTGAGAHHGAIRRHRLLGAGGRIGPGDRRDHQRADRAWRRSEAPVLVEYNPGFCALLRDRYPHAKVVQGDAYALRDSLWNVLSTPASAVVSGLPLVTKPMLTRLKLIRDAFLALAPGAPFVQFTYSVAPPIPKSLPGVSTEASERIWMNLPPARVWVYRRD